MSAAEKIPEDVTELVRSKSVFMAACAYTVGIYRKDPTINFTLPITIQTYGLLTSKPKPLSRALLFASPYSNEVSNDSIKLSLVSIIEILIPGLGPADMCDFDSRPSALRGTFFQSSAC